MFIQTVFIPIINYARINSRCFQILFRNAVMNCFFIFNGKFFKQTDGLGMGLPLGCTFANIFMCFHEENWLANCPHEFKPIFYRRYIDDTFLLFTDISHVSLFLNYINSQHNNIHFTYEIEHNNKLPFLDTIVNRKSGKFETTVYRNPTFSGLGLSNYSYCSSLFKLNAIKTLLFRAYGICSNYVLLHSEFQFITKYFRNNGFCSNFINKQIKMFLSKKYNFNSTSSTNEPIKYNYVVFPYFGTIR